MGICIIFGISGCLLLGWKGLKSVKERIQRDDGMRTAGLKKSGNGIPG